MKKTHSWLVLTAKISASILYILWIVLETALRFVCLYRVSTRALEQVIIQMITAVAFQFFILENIFYGFQQQM